jgi:hypothetical protein
MDRSTQLTARAALAVAAVSIALNGWLLYRVTHAQAAILPAADRALQRMAAEDVKIRYRIRLPAGTPVHFDVPIDKQYTVHLDTQLPIDTKVTLPIRSPLGRWDIAVPVKANVPIRTDLPVHLKDTFRLRTQTQTELVIPLELRVRDLPLDALHRSLNP